MNAKYFSFIFCVYMALVHVCNAADIVASTKEFTDHYLSKPTGQYSIGSMDLYWINQSICPDPNFDGKNQVSFSPNNINYCHETIVRIYYPTVSHKQPSVPYYPAFIKSQQETLKQISHISQKQIEQLNQIKSFSIEKAPIVRRKTFPVILFSSGFGCPAELYENIINELVSQGYIVMGINTHCQHIISE